MRALENARNEDRKLMVRRGFDGGGDSEQSLVERILDLEQQVDQLQSLAKELKQDNQRERHELAIVLQDQVQQLLVGTRMFANCLSDSVRDAGDKHLAAQIDALLAQAIAEVRALTSQLGPPPIRPNPVSLTSQVNIGLA